MKISTDRFEEIEKILEPLARRFNRNTGSFLDNASDLRIKRVSLVTGISQDELRACQAKIRGWRTLGLIEQDLHFARKYRPEDVPFWERKAEEIRAGI